VCARCKEDYALIKDKSTDNFCMPKCSEIKNCSVCSKPHECQTCEIGYIKFSEKECAPECNKVTNCTSCISPNRCNPESCKNGYKEVDGKCEVICAIDNCDTCLLPNICSNPTAGWLLNKTNNEIYPEC